MKKHPGFTLIEICIVVTILSIMMTLAAGIIHGLMGSNHQARQVLEQQTTLAALAETFRADVHAAVEFQPPAADKPGPPQWELKPQDGPTVVYRLQENTLIRETKTPAGPTWRTFELCKGATIAVNERRQGETTLVTLTVKAGFTATGAPGRAAAGLRVEARLARDKQLAEVPALTTPPAAAPETEEKPNDE